MKKILIAIIAVFTLGAFNTATAQKLGHLDYIAVMDSLETYKTAIKKTEEIQISYEATMKALQDEYQQKLAEYQGAMDTLTPVIRELRENTLIGIQQTSEQLQGEFQQSGQIIQERYFVPLEKWLKEAVAIVGERKGLDYVLYYDEQSSIFWVNPNKGTDVTNEVITEMLRLEKANPIVTPGG